MQSLEMPALTSVKLLSRISWFMPHVTPADKDKMELYKIIERKEKLSVGYRMIQCHSASIPQALSFSWRLSVESSPEVPRFIIVGFQTNKINNQEQNPSIFNNVNVSNIYVMLNSHARIQISFSGGGPTENTLVLLYDTLISGFQWV